MSIWQKFKKMALAYKRSPTAIFAASKLPFLPQVGEFHHKKGTCRKASAFLLGTGVLIGLFEKPCITNGFSDF